ncbi:glycosyltransferase family 2 protein [Octadecabacter sp. R77987]|uniref:glycosyltransferase family 2 protein n=1 Tax=Octadecabacter sp. R77987 TaxID=3093874 RepID=UPI00366BEF0A
MTHALIAIPALNEENTIAAVLSDLLADCHAFPIVVIDGGSTDNTCDIVRGFAKRHPRVSLRRNPHRTQAHAINAAAHLAQSLGAQILVRVDAHARYPKGFVNTLVRLVQDESADSVVTPLIATDQRNPWAQAGALLQRSWLGNGGATHRNTANSGWVAHGHHAAFRLKAFLALGGYDTSFHANEDAEYDHRLIMAGGRIFLAAHLPVRYCPRATPRDVFRQYWRNGFWRTQMLRHHRQRPATRQVLPVLATVICPLSFALGWFWVPLALPCLVYLCALATLALHAAKFAPRTCLRVVWLAMMMHFGFGLGSLASLRTRSTHDTIKQATA